MAYGKAIIGIVTVGPTFTTGAWLLLSAGISNTHFSLESINMSGVASFHWEKKCQPISKFDTVEWILKCNLRQNKNNICWC